MRRPLFPHPGSPAPALRLEAEAVRAPHGLTLVYHLAGDVSVLKLPAPAGADRTDELWKHTCFEAFIRPAGGDGYCEFNFSPSTQWAAYRFNAYRQGIAPLATPTPNIDLRQSAQTLEMRVGLALGGAPLLEDAARWRVGLSAVIEDAAGAISYWALAHPSGKADFHHDAGFVLDLERA
jgi:hypothetical protein